VAPCQWAQRAAARPCAPAAQLAATHIDGKVAIEQMPDAAAQQ
jgi:hypothetical protein